MNDTGDQKLLPPDIQTKLDTLMTRAVGVQDDIATLHERINTLVDNIESDVDIASLSIKQRIEQFRAAEEETSDELDEIILKEAEVLAQEEKGE